MKNLISIFLLSFLIFSIPVSAQKKGFYENVQKKNINKLLDDFNTFAANADFEKYFDCLDKNAVFIGTDAAEIWSKAEFKDWAKPYFENKKTWNFKSLSRNLYFSKDGNYAWFDELLDTKMEICRGSGVVEKIGGKWKIKQYVLSVTVPNEVVNDVVKLKSPIESSIISKLKNSER